MAGGADGEPPAGRGRVQLADGRVPADRRAALPRRRLDQRAQPAGQGAEDRGAGGAGRGGLGGPDRADQGVLHPGRPGQRRHGGDQGQVVGPAGVHAAEHRVDQPLHHLVAEPVADQRADRHVLVRAEQRPAAVAVGVRGRRRHRRHLRQIPRYADQGAARDGAQPAVDGERGLPDGGVDDRVGQPEPADQADGGGLRAGRVAHQELLGAELDGLPGQFAGAQLAAEGAGLLVHGDLSAGGGAVTQPDGGGQPGDPATDHRHPPRLPHGHSARSTGRAERSCTSATTRVSTSGSVSGSTP